MLLLYENYNHKFKRKPQNFTNW